MEYALIGLFMIFQELLNMLMTLEVVEGVPLGGVIIALIILSVFLQNFKMRNDDSGFSGSSKSFSSKSKGE